jgi:hypothetical protein
MSSTMWKNGVSKVFHNREIVEAKKTGWTFSPVKTIVKTKKTITVPKYKLEVKEVDVLQSKTTDLPGPEDLQIEGDE